MSVKGSMLYRDAGVLDNTELGLRALLGWVNRTSEFRGPGQLGPQGRGGRLLRERGRHRAWTRSGPVHGRRGHQGADRADARALRHDRHRLRGHERQRRHLRRRRAHVVSRLHRRRVGHSGGAGSDRQGALRGRAAGRREHRRRRDLADGGSIIKGSGRGRASTSSACAPASSRSTGSSSAAT